MENQKQTQKNKITEMIESALESIRGIADAGTVIGEPVITPQGTTIVSVSKVSIGFAGGGNDFTGRSGEKDGKNNFSGGGGTGISVNPVAFLVVSPDGKVELLSLANPGSSVGASLDSLIEKAPDLIDKIKDVIGSKKKKDKKKSDKSEKNEKIDASEKTETSEEQA